MNEREMKGIFKFFKCIFIHLIRAIWIVPVGIILAIIQAYLVLPISIIWWLISDKSIGEILKYAPFNLFIEFLSNRYVKKKSGK